VRRAQPAEATVASVASGADLGALVLEVNGQRVDARAEVGAPLLSVLRGLGLTGAKRACGQGECGACTVLLDGRAVMSCMLLAGDVGTRAVTTVEGLADSCADLRAAFADRGAFQCGFCTPGHIVRAEALLRDGGATDEAQVRKAISGNICRCTGYAAIVDAVLDTAAGRQAAS
jgi:aerobic-type carbon monoxide dehydrogenase small subunit (CoxS/CutS family)